jgi:hypothetical protein
LERGCVRSINLLQEHPMSRIPLRKYAYLPLLLLTGCGSSGDQPRQDPPPFLDSGSPDNVCVTPNPNAQAPHSLGTTPEVLAATQGQASAEVATSPLTDPLGESIALADNYTGLVQGTLYNTAAWPIWWGNGKPVAGVNCLIGSTWHKHALISIYNNGKRLGLPDGIGRVHAGCYHAYEMHVHDVTGIIHMESDSPKNFTLADWFAVWNQPLSRDGVAGLPGPVRFYIVESGKITRFDGDPKTIPMAAHREIVIVTGTPLATVPKYQWPYGI